MAKAIILKDGRKLREVCKEYNLKLQLLQSYKSNHPELDYDTIIEIYLNKDKSFAKKCSIAGINSTRAYGIRKIHKDWTDEQIISYCKKLDDNISIKQACKMYGIHYGDNILAFAKQFKNKTNIEIVNIWMDRLNEKENKTKYIKESLESNDISMSTYYKVKNRFPDYSLEDIVKYILNKRNNTKTKNDYIGEERTAINGQKMKILEYNSNIDITVKFEDGTVTKARYNNFIQGRVKNPSLDKTLKLRELCKYLGIDYNKVYSYKKLHPELTDEQVIIYYKPDCYVSIFGEFVIPEN